MVSSVVTPMATSMVPTVPGRSPRSVRHALLLLLLAAGLLVPAGPAMGQPEQEPQPIRCKVVWVDSHDVLMVRFEPGVDALPVGVLLPVEPYLPEIEAAQPDILLDRPAAEVKGHAWYHVRCGRLSGWVMGRHLTERVDSKDFCASDEARAVLEGLRQAVRDQDGARLAGLVHPERGLEVFYYRWSGRVWFSADELRDAFRSDTVKEFGHYEGSGEPITGSFKEILLPLLRKDLLGGTQTACDRELAPSGSIDMNFPFGGESIHHFSVLQPDNGGMDWGSWTIGVEHWEGRWYLSYLMHYMWTI